MFVHLCVRVKENNEAYKRRRLFIRARKADAKVRIWFRDEPVSSKTSRAHAILLSMFLNRLPSNADVHSALRMSSLVGLENCSAREAKSGQSRSANYSTFKGNTWGITGKYQGHHPKANWHHQQWRLQGRDGVLECSDQSDSQASIFGGIEGASPDWKKLFDVPYSACVEWVKLKLEKLKDDIHVLGCHVSAKPN